MRALIVTNMYPTRERPELGSFVRDQVDALRGLGAEIEVFAFPPGGPGAYLRATRAARARHGGGRWDVVHAHFGLSALPALAVRGAPHGVTLHGTDLRHPRSGRITRALLHGIDLPAAVSPELAAEVPRRAVRGREVAVLPCGVATGRFRPLSRAEARRELGLDPDTPFVLLPADPARPVKRADRARALAAAAGVPLRTLGGVAPAAVPLWVNAAAAVLVPSESEGFGLALLEALACDVPVLATPVGVAPAALAELPGALCAPWDLPTWLAALRPHLAVHDPRVEGRERAERWSAERMAARVLEAWEALLSSRS